MADFKIYYPELAKHEGGYANDPDDNGGETYKGIARKIHPTWLGWLRVDIHVKALGGRLKVKNNTKFIDPVLDKMVYDFFYLNYWVKPSFDTIKNQSLAELLADWKINGGFNGDRVKTLQRLVNTTADGNWGNLSSLALNKFAVNKAKAQVFFDLVISIRDTYYRSLSDFWKFGNTWIKRLYSNTLDFNRNNAWKIGGLALFITGATVYWYTSMNSNKNKRKPKRTQK